MKELDISMKAQSHHTEMAKDVVLKYSSNGQLRAKMRAPIFEHKTELEPPYIDISGGFVVDFFNEGQPTSVLTAKKARLFEKTSNVLVRDSVKVVGENGETLRTQELIWNQDKQKFFTDKAVTIQTKDNIIHGDGMEANQDFTDYTILNPRGVISLDNSQKLW
jgi:LPS export ABC transporter protein LptC